MTELYGLLGHPIAHSRSPALHRRWFAEHGIDAAYHSFDTDDPAAIDAAFVLGLRGANLTTPLKCVDSDRIRREPDAEAIGAVNVLIRDRAGWIGANTDGEGFLRSLALRGVSPDGRRCVVFGAGGAARAVAVTLARSGAASIAIRARDPAQAERLAGRVGASAGPIDAQAAAGAELVVVATAGRAEALGSIDLDHLGPAPVWADLNYWDPHPPGFDRARSAGCTTVDGWGMLVFQGAAAFERWTGRTVDAAALVLRGSETL